MSCAMAAAVGASAETQNKPAKAKTTPNIVLVHGAWADGSSWNGVTERLQKAGYTVTSVQVPNTSLDEDVARTRAVLSQQTGPTILVGHSFGGAIISQLGKDAPNVVGLVFVSAFGPDKGETMKGLTSAPPEPAGASAIRPDKSGNVTLDREGYLKFFAAGVEPGLAKAMSATQQPIAASEFLSQVPFDEPSWKTLPSWFLITTEDQMLPPEAQQLFAKRMNATITKVKGGHASLVSHADAVANFIMKAASSAGTVGIR
jgi:pimeloyl-ACP methyl ester carboxylesterase